MNYALDALWWKLKTPAVRDLASLLTAPALWESGCELAVCDLLGKEGFRTLLALDENPKPLQNFLHQKSPFSYRLGLYAEQLLAFWFSHAPHTKLIAHNLEIFSAHQTKGAADFIVLLNNISYHIELTCKYYGSHNGDSTNLCGLNTQDTFNNKVKKLTHQLTLLKSSDGINSLMKHQIPLPIHTASIVRGIAFFPDSISPILDPPINPYGWHGSYLENWSHHQAENINHRYYLLSHMELLAPARIESGKTITLKDVQKIPHGLVAKLEKRPDGFWHEVQRIMINPKAI